MSNTWETTVIEDAETGEMVIEFPDEFLAQVGWNEGDVLQWVINSDGSLTLEKAN